MEEPQVYYAYKTRNSDMSKLLNYETSPSKTNTVSLLNLKENHIKRKLFKDKHQARSIHKYRKGSDIVRDAKLLLENSDYVESPKRNTFYKIN